MRKEQAPPLSDKPPLPARPSTPSVRRWPIWLGIVLVIAIVATGLWWTLARPLRVAGFVLVPTSFTRVAAAPGYLTSLKRAAIGPRTSGRLVAHEAEVGDTVAAGEAVARFDAAAQTAELAAANAALNAASAELAGAEAQRDLATRTLATAEATAERQRGLAATDMISTADLERAEQALAEAQGSLASAEAAVTAAEAAREAAMASRDAAQASRDDLVLEAPFAGEVVAHFAQPGEIVAAATPVLELADPASLAVEVRVDETALPFLVAGQPARIVLRAEPGKSLAGRVASLERRLDPERRDAMVLVALDAAPASWTLDQRADVEMATGQLNHVLVAPLGAIGWHQQRPFALVAVAGRAERRMLTLGPASADHVVVASGLAAGDRVLLDPHLPPGRAVELLP